jgi:hypothetical protein
MRTKKMKGAAGSRSIGKHISVGLGLEWRVLAKAAGPVGGARIGRWEDANDKEAK